MKNEKFNQVIDEVYNHYLETHKDEMFILEDEMDLSKEEFIKKATNNYGFSFLFGLEFRERNLTFEEQIEWVMRNTDVEMENLYITEEVYKPTTPTKIVTLFYKGEETKFYK
jgi:hypothetical protein